MEPSRAQLKYTYKCIAPELSRDIYQLGKRALGFSQLGHQQEQWEKKKKRWEGKKRNKEGGLHCSFMMLFCLQCEFQSVQLRPHFCYFTDDGFLGLAQANIGQKKKNNKKVEEKSFNVGKKKEAFHCDVLNSETTFSVWRYISPRFLSLRINKLKHMHCVCLALSNKWFAVSVRWIIPEIWVQCRRQ